MGRPSSDLAETVGIMADVMIRGDTLVVSRLKQIGKSSLDKIGNAIEAAQVIVVNDAKANHPGKGTPAMGGAGRATDPATGTPRYADQTAQLTQSIKPGQVKKSLMGIDGSVLAGGSGMEAANYAPFVEFGTSRMVAFPFFRPALHRNKKKIRDTLNTYLQKGLR